MVGSQRSNQLRQPRTHFSYTSLAIRPILDLKNTKSEFCLQGTLLKGKFNTQSHTNTVWKPHPLAPLISVYSTTSESTPPPPPIPPRGSRLAPWCIHYHVALDVLTRLFLLAHFPQFVFIQLMRIACYKIKIWKYIRRFQSSRVNRKTASRSHMRNVWHHRWFNFYIGYRLSRLYICVCDLKVVRNNYCRLLMRAVCWHVFKNCKIPKLYLQ